LIYVGVLILCSRLTLGSKVQAVLEAWLNWRWTQYCKSCPKTTSANGVS